MLKRACVCATPGNDWLKQQFAVQSIPALVLLDRDGRAKRPAWTHAPSRTHARTHARTHGGYHPVAAHTHARVRAVASA